MNEFGPFTFREATNRDAQAVWALISDILASYGIRMNPQTTDTDLVDIEATYWRQQGAFYVLLDGSRVIGTVALHPHPGGACELCRMYLAAEYRGRGLGRRLLAHATSRARAQGYSELMLKTSSRLNEAISLYRRSGFEPDSCAAASGNCDLVIG